MTFIHESTHNGVSENDLSQGFTINLRDKRYCIFLGNRITSLGRNSTSTDFELSSCDLIN